MLLDVDGTPREVVLGVDERYGWTRVFSGIVQTELKLESLP